MIPAFFTVYGLLFPFNFLSYNVTMKKIILLIALILSVNCAYAQSFDMTKIKNIFYKPSQSEKEIAKEQASEDELTPSAQAAIYYNDNNEKTALDTLLTIKEADRTAQDWLLLGNILQDQGKPSDAIFMYQRAILLNPKYYKPYYNLGNIYLEEEKPMMAIENYRKANKANNEFSYGYYNLGCAYLKIGDLKKAKIAFLKAVELKNTVPEFHYNLAYTYKKLNNPKLSKQYLDFYNKLMEAAQQ
jgi:tetratricopeptide (TPR) repeat protein